MRKGWRKVKTTEEIEEQRQRYRANRNEKNRTTRFSYFKRYEKTLTGFLMRGYRNMKSRITGVQKSKHHLYAGKELMAKEDYYALARGSEVFMSLFKAWEDSGYDRKLTPSLDRVDSSKGYVDGNLEWVTHSENSRRGNVSRFKGRTPE